MSDTRFPIYEPNRNESLNRGLVGWWLASGKTGWGTQTWRDISGYGNHGTLTGMNLTARWQSVIDRPAIDFPNDETQYVNLGVTPFLDNIVESTYVMDLRNDSTATQTPYGKGNNTEQGHILINNGQFGIYRLYSTQYMSYKSSLSLMQLGVWYQCVAVCYADKTAKLYINGKETAYAEQIQGVGTISSDAGLNAYIGRRPSASHLRFDGQIARFSVHNRALTDAEVHALYLDSLRGYRRTLRFRKVPFAVGTAAPAATPWYYVRRNAYIIGGGF